MSVPSWYQAGSKPVPSRYQLDLKFDSILKKTQSNLTKRPFGVDETRAVFNLIDFYNRNGAAEGTLDAPVSGNSCFVETILTTPIGILFLCGAVYKSTFS